MAELRVSEIAADSRCSRRRSAGGDGGTTLLRSARSDEDGGNPANIAASGASNQNRARCPSSSRRERGERTKGQRISGNAESGDDAGSTGRHVRMVAELLPAEDVGDVQLNNASTRPGDSVMQSHAGVGVSRGVQHRADPVASRLNPPHLLFVAPAV